MRMEKNTQQYHCDSIKIPISRLKEHRYTHVVPVSALNATPSFTIRFHLSRRTVKYQLQTY